MTAENYAQDRDFLRNHTEIIELAAGDARLAVAPDYQGRAMTSTLAGEDGESFGWLNRDFIASGQESPVFNNYGGEDRFWLGPEGGQFALWFRKDSPFDLEHWYTPPGFNTGRFAPEQTDERTVVMNTRFEVTNYSGHTFDCAVRREIRLLDDEVPRHLGGEVPEGVRFVAFQSANTLTNASGEPWTRTTGMPSIWILGQFKPLPRGKVIVPFVPGSEGDLGPRATLDYFGELPPERGVLEDDHLLFACDGEYRSKIGISPQRARDVVGSYDPDAGVLTIVQFTLPADAEKLPYVNSLWEMQEHPFAGDVVNSYNDGHPPTGGPQLGPFYEIETSSPAAKLDGGRSIAHTHRTMHFAGDFDPLNALAENLLGVNLAEVG